MMVQTWQQGAVVGGRYRIEAPIGRGGYGSVHQAVTLDGSRRVALKLLSRAARISEAADERFRREAEIASKLVHPSTVRVLDFGDAGDGTPFIAFELLRGTTVADLIASKGPMPDAEILRVALAVLGSLEEAHALGIVHRDVKPANVMIVEGGGVKLLDFGVAKTEGDDPAALTGGVEIIGTAEYMAPEQISQGRLAPATDLYALALTMAEMLSGRPVYQGSPMAICVEKLRQGRPTLPSRAMMSPFGPVLERATRREASARYSSAAEMRAALAASGVARRAPGAPAEALAPTVRQPPKWRSSRARLALVIAAVAVTVAAGAAGFYAVSNRQPVTWSELELDSCELRTKSLKKTVKNIDAFVYRGSPAWSTIVHSPNESSFDYGIFHDDEIVGRLYVGPADQRDASLFERYEPTILRAFDAQEFVVVVGTREQEYADTLVGLVCEDQGTPPDP